MNFFKKLAGKLNGSTELLSAALHGAYEAAAADGSVDASELTEAINLVKSNEKLLTLFTADEIQQEATKVFGELAKITNTASRRLLVEGKLKALSERSFDDRVVTYLTMFSVAAADGTIDDSEKAICARFLPALGLSQSDVAQVEADVLA